jgi:hypothetical protein
MRAMEAWPEDLITALLSVGLVAGLFLDGWNHINLQNGALGEFVTLWHGLLYLGFTATALWVLTRNPHLYTRGVGPQPYFYKVLGVPLRYPLAIVGLVVAMVGLSGDIVWHSIYGTERGVARVIAPFHLLLFAGAAGLVSASLRSAWYAPHIYPRVSSFRQLLPPLISVALVTCVAAFMFQWLSAFIDWRPSIVIGRVPPAFLGDERVASTTEYAGAARVLLTNLLMLAPIFLILPRWRLPFGSVTLVFGLVTVAMAALTTFALGWTIIAALVGGLVADTLLLAYEPDAHDAYGYRLMAVLAPLAMWSAYFLILGIAYDIRWPFDLWLGTTGLAAISGLLLSYVAIAPDVGTAPATAEAR